MTTATTPSFRLVDSGWDDVLAAARKADSSTLRLICPFIQLKPIERLLSHGKPHPLHVLTRFSLDDFADRVSDVRALRLLLEHGAQVRGIKNLHAKMYLMGDGHAVVTSANLTDKALLENHEFGFETREPGIARECRQYFDRLWSRAGKDLTLDRLDDWEARIGKHLASGARPLGKRRLGDMGADAGIDSTPIESGWVGEAEQTFIKLLGESTNRKPLDFPTIEEVRRAGCHWALTYPKMLRPRRVRDGAMMFIARMTERPNDIRVFGRAIGMKHVPGRDDATPADIAFRGRDWKARWPRYIRVHHAEFINGTMGDGISMNEMMDTLGAECFASTLRNKQRGEGNTDPRAAYKQKPAIELSPIGARWMTERLNSAFAKVGKQPLTVMEALDWPKVPTQWQGSHS